MTSDESFLQYLGGLQNNFLNNILDDNTNQTNELNELKPIRLSSYFDSDAFDALCKKNKNCFSIISSNIQFINAKFSELEAFVEELKTENIQLSVICLQESCISKNDDFSHIQLEGYNCITQGKTSSKKGGLIIYVDSKYTYEVIQNLNNYELWEGLIIKVSEGGLTKPAIIGNIYRPPRNLIDNLKQFITEFSLLLSSLDQIQHNVIFAGDYNINLLKLNEDELISDFFDLLTSHSMYPQITLPTRFSEKHGTLIDNLFCKLTKTILESRAGILIKQFSDHQPYFIFMDTTQNKQLNPKTTKIHMETNEALLKVKHDIHAADIYSKMDKSPNADTNSNYNLIDQIIETTKNKHIQTKVVKFHKYRHKKSNWITKGILRSIKYRDKLYKQLKMLDPDCAQYTTSCTNLKTYNVILKKNIREAKRLHYVQLFDKYKFNAANTWKAINEIISRHKSSTQFPTYFKQNNKTYTNKIDIANEFNHIFTETGPNLAENIQCTTVNNITKFLKNKNTNGFRFTEIQEESVSQIINNLPNKNSYGCDGISSKLLKLIEPDIVKPLTLLINQVLNTGQFPDKLKVAKVIPIFKKNDPTLFTNYRPISLLPVISKVLERIMNNQLLMYFTNTKLLSDSQYGFRPHHSTEYAALEIVDRITTHLDNNQLPISIFLDLSKAFDTLDHTILLKKLEHYGLEPSALQLLKSYLTNREQFVKIDDIKSNVLPINTGVPQGSILGPLLFIIYINDFSQASNVFKFITYADDTSLVSTLGSFTNGTNNPNTEHMINTELHNIAEWLKLNKLTLNINKTKYMIFQMPNKKVTVPTLTIDGVNIERVQHFNFLGLILDTHLNWNKHIEKIANKCSRTIGIINKLKHVLPKSIRIILYNSLILPHINYCLMIWGYQCNRIIKLQKKAIRIISVTKYNSHTEPLFKSLSVLKVEDLLKVQILRFYYKFIHKQLPAYLQSWPINQNTHIHNHFTRKHNKIHTFRTQHEFAKKCLKYNLPHIINNTPDILKDKVTTHSLQGYISYAKKIIIKSYVCICTEVNCYTCTHGQ